MTRLTVALWAAVAGLVAEVALLLAGSGDVLAVAAVGMAVAYFVGRKVSGRL